VPKLTNKVVALLGLLVPHTIAVVEDLIATVVVSACARDAFNIEVHNEHRVVLVMHIALNPAGKHPHLHLSSITEVVGGVEDVGGNLVVDSEFQPLAAVLGEGVGLDAKRFAVRDGREEVDVWSTCIVVVLDWQARKVHLREDRVAGKAAISERESRRGDGSGGEEVVEVPAVAVDGSGLVVTALRRAWRCGQEEPADDGGDDGSKDRQTPDNAALRFGFGPSSPKNWLC